MSIVIRRNNGDILWFDAVVDFTETYSATVTKHPIANGGFVSDHTTIDNKVLQLSAVLSDADFNLSRTLVEAKDYQGKPITPKKQFTNNTTTAIPVSISEQSIRASLANKFLPEIVAQFTKDTIPQVIVTPQEKAKTALAVKGEMIQMWQNKEEFQVLDIDANFVTSAFGPCVFTSLSFKEDEQSGTAIWPVMTIEEVVYVDVENIKIQVRASNKGRRVGTTTEQNKDASTGNGGNAKTQPTNYEDQSALNVAQKTTVESK